MFAQAIAPIGSSLALSTAVAAIPVIAVLVVLGVLRKPAWMAAGTGLVLALLISLAGWHMPAPLALDSMAYGAVFALSPVIWIVVTTLRQYWRAGITVMLIVSLAYLTNYSGLAYTLGQGVASTGHVFILLSPFLGWLAVMLSGSDTAGNALLGNLQVVAANQLNLSPVLFAATNSSGGVMGKMISPQNIATGVSVTNLAGQEGRVFARTFLHSIVLTLVLGLLVALQQFWIPWVIPH
jgi:L-lactate permease